MGQRRSDDNIQDELRQLQKELKFLKTLMPSSPSLVEADEHPETMPKLYGNQPNPFDHFTIVNYFVPGKDHQRISLFVVDERGNQKMFLDDLEGGKQRLFIKDHALGPGFYFCSLVVDGRIVETCKMEVRNEADG